MKPGPMMEEPAPTEEGSPTSRGPIPMMEEAPETDGINHLWKQHQQKEMTNEPRKEPQEESDYRKA